MRSHLITNLPRKSHFLVAVKKGSYLVTAVTEGKMFIYLDSTHAQHYETRISLRPSYAILGILLCK